MMFETNYSSQIEVDGEPLWHMKHSDRLISADGQHLRRMRSKIGMVFQHFNLFSHISAPRDVADPVRTVLGISVPDATELARELLVMGGLQNELHANPARQLSGQQQRLAIACALAMRPSIMLFDEISWALDPELLGGVLKVSRMLAREHDLTMIMFTHQMFFAKDIADRVLFFEGGCIVEQGEPDQVFGSPQNDRTPICVNSVLET